MVSNKVKVARLGLEKDIDYPIYKNPITARNICKALTMHLLSVLPPETVHIRIFCRGSSGSYMAGIISNILVEINPHQVTVFYSRKNQEDAHCSSFHGLTEKVKGDIDVFVDDRIHRGSTISNIIEQLKYFNYGYGENPIKYPAFKFDYILMGYIEYSYITNDGIENHLSDKTDNLILAI